MTEPFVEIDGSLGEGGGQILRSALTMSLITQRPFHVTKIRAGRPRPGIGHQHLEAIHAAAQISHSEVEGDELQSQELTFIPGIPEPGKYTFQVATAGSVSLIFQTVVLPLALAGKASEIELKGGTHVLWAPPYDYLRDIWGKMMQNLGLELTFTLHQAGYYPKGGGALTIKINPVSRFKTLECLERNALVSLEIRAIISKLSQDIAKRELASLTKGIAALGLAQHMQTRVEEYPAPNPGNMAFIGVNFGNMLAGFSSIGEKGKTAEKVAEEVLADFRQFWSQHAPVEQYLADQLLLPLTFADGPSSYRVAQITQHLTTNAYIIQKFKDIRIAVEGKEGESGVVKVYP